jgi:hypothetical protein
MVLLLAFPLALASCGSQMPAGWEGSTEIRVLEKTALDPVAASDSPTTATATRTAQGVVVRLVNAHVSPGYTVTAYQRPRGDGGTDVLFLVSEGSNCMCTAFYDIAVLASPSDGSEGVSVYLWDSGDRTPQPVKVADVTIES